MGLTSQCPGGGGKDLDLISALIFCLSKVGRHACPVKIIEKFGMVSMAERKGEAKGIGIATGIERPAMVGIK